LLKAGSQGKCNPKDQRQRVAEGAEVDGGVHNGSMGAARANSNSSAAGFMKLKVASFFRSM
jgi:hypothetical protein